MKSSLSVLSGIMGALIIILVGIIIFAWVAPVDVAPVYMLNPSVALDSFEAYQLDSLKCQHIELLRDLESKGVLMNPAEYTSHISDFYNTLVAFLIGIFVIFSFIGIYLMKSTNKIEFEEFKQDITNKTQESIRNQLSILLNDSISIKETIVSALYGRIEDEIVTVDKIEAIESSVEKIQNDIELLYDSLSEIEENMAANETVSDKKE